MEGELGRRCVRCDDEPGFNRAVLDVVAGAEVGALCRNCELDVLVEPESYERGSRDGACGCPGCDRDATFALPRWLPETTVSNGAVESRVDYGLDEHPLSLCDEHYGDLVSGSSVPSTPLASAAEHR
ncbi:hypothetical protein [Halovivax sp.]|uniref:hypothetical protein n=1 Tax=Halovivax sp. TaxID=1935978 RepID=UPI0025BC61FA|nr:hypothetical protein [Halovivax sp.]